MAEKTVSADTSTLTTLRNLWPYMWPADRADLRARVTWATLLLVVAKVTLVAGPYFFKWATDALAGGFKTPPPLPSFLLAPVMLVIAYNVLRLVQLGFNQLRDALFARVGQHAVRQLAFRTFVHMHQLSLRFHLERRTGGLSRIIERGTKGIETIVRFIMLNTAPTILEFALTAGIFGFTYGWKYVAVVAVTVCVYVWFTVKASDWRISIRRDMNDSDTDANTKAIDSLLNFETVKYFTNEAMEAERFDRSMARYEIAATKTWTSLGWLNFGQGAIFGLGTVVVMCMSALEVQAHTQTVGDFVFINAMLVQLSVPLNFIGFIYREIRQGLTDIEHMFDLLDVPQEIVDKPDAKPLVVSAGKVEFRDVHFSYDPNRKILKGVSFDVPAGKTIAIVGPSGAGKSTISRLLFRFYDVQGGQVLIDGQDIRDVTQESLRAVLGMVPQDTVLFNDTIAYNIRYGRVGASEEEVRKAAELAQIGPFIEKLPDGYKSMVGERGLKLSGGEKQRVAIARTILKAPPILMLDEATSALDSHTEQEIQAALDLVSKGRTTIVIAHRLSTVISADEIIVLKDGQIAERGTHIELMRQHGLYASMWDRQREATEAEERLRRARESDEFGVIVRRRTSEVS
ncbi:ABC transporter ATP-binding protein/permease [Mesorhizobium sp. B283B1A]|uniref:ABC transporter related protein n=1 Tax=Mesorhizobium opportunistum (strain LMG 24607 / HAMBI 3007 / WSM2075) TaxID=536019 RepID=F7Y667_MESOW|nr:MULTISPECIES: ABC transporter ATP-binding protein/permease [Mesorhizobium]AEH89692.1 ABC transporter related protein [Mesorhizobium opportunistum WSM2075]MCA0032006.1 ABC transporter ATP-binding protein/permease [Mesorhizobium sp. B263B2A]MCA0051096.1 ABC transporter ATP-binding protein/permease [Mesorhizobium sp. B283B1A]TPN43313.1 ATP-binding cassette domain-containing protein [Mesorhizobium sp. B1-1-9]UQS63654.1 ABC transporter ATP-binding protein/permease [Mesorhizobium opportunistum]